MYVYIYPGMLYALGLQGHLKVLTVSDICDYLTQGHDPTTVAVLLGTVQYSTAQYST